MGKDTFYFSHDYNCRSDIKIKLMIRKHGMAAYGLYWSIVEDLYNNQNALPLDYSGMAKEFSLPVNFVKSVINDFNLFFVKDGILSNNSVQRRLEERKLKSESARIGAASRWNKMRTHSEINANGYQTESDTNAIKERKGKEIKEKKGGVGENSRGVKFDKSKKSVIFPDGTKQALGTNQFEQASENKLQPKDVTKGIVY